MTGAVLVAAVLLAWAGVAKAWRPAPTARALAAAGVPVGAALVRVLAVAEVAIAAGAVAGGGPFAALMGCSYAAFALFVGIALRRGLALSSCGCFGVADGRPTAAHLVVDALLAAASFAYAGGRSRPAAYLAGHPGVGAGLGLVAVVTAGLLVAVLSVLPAAAAP
ncbi:MAG TPA: MauE/DoxX family redox-associated membrane protein [Acidimicrobiales bacterium]|nr:MauE/DoxX family redox-associated membrane protein [Acidimicrobiales bacterium]